MEKPPQKSQNGYHTNSSKSIEAYGQDEKKNGSAEGLSVLGAAVLVAGEMAGSGILALPKAVIDCGWPGLLLVLLFCLNACYGGTKLGNCWAILEERYPEHKKATRDPYPTIAFRAVGRWGSTLVSACIQVTLFGVAIVYLLLSAQIVQQLLRELLPQVGYCLWFLIFAIVITPPMWLGSPKDFWIAGVGAVLTTAIACVLIFINMISDGIHNTEPVPHNPHSLTDFFFSFGTILFTYGGASTFPTIQNDMARRDKFYISVAMGYVVVLALYMPVVFAAFFVYGDAVNANVVLSLSRGMFASFANMLMALHLILALLIVINPVCQEIEEIFNVPHKFGGKRCLVRSLMVLLMIVVGETIPEFGKILALVGGSSITLCTFILPPYFYMRLCDQKRADWPERLIPWYERGYMWVLIIIGLVGGVCCTYSAGHSILSANSLTTPCYWPD
ncbi:uncharacterized protein LOC128994825 [Macrosteles quadrilineatus]|uniref:uncharacterized protein LOC128994825 n=1 Tax=Macrosteles quadrilineatus TaxID=74068 RepID=UPI0023E200E3|nr:uncharacterized protein LOC128994825 [Macrosteles quadrilineatus]